jgi:4-hydroxybenzoate polyprenyltransferase
MVARTRTRPIASGAIPVRRAVVFLGLLLALGLAVLVQFNWTTIWLGAASLLLVFPYPLMKRITWWPQAFLGITFNWGALLGWTAVTGSLGWPAVLLYGAGAAWTIAYDTIYAHQDKEDDARIGVKSTALRFGTASKRLVAGFYGLAFAGIAAAGLGAGLSPVFLAFLGAGALLLLLGLVEWRPDDAGDCLRRFKDQRWFAWAAA